MGKKRKEKEPFLTASDIAAFFIGLVVLAACGFTLAASFNLGLQITSAL